jgi:hypothetical protein
LFEPTLDPSYISLDNTFNLRIQWKRFDSNFWKIEDVFGSESATQIPAKFVPGRYEAEPKKKEK